MELVCLIEERTRQDCPHLEHKIFAVETGHRQHSPRGPQSESDGKAKFNGYRGGKACTLEASYELMRLMDEATRTATSDASTL